MTLVAAAKLNKEKADEKYRCNMQFKVWLALLRHVNECREERQQEEQRLQDYRERNQFKGVEVRPCLDKILPEELEI